MIAQTARVSQFASPFRSSECLPVCDKALMARVFKLRFQVYCVECGLLARADYPDRQESDAYDAASTHFCAFNQGDELVGYVRLVRCGPGLLFPFQTRCHSLSEGVTLPPPEASAEISRLIVRHDYRRRRGDTVAGVTAASADNTRECEKRDRSPQILLSLYRQMYLQSLAQGVRYWYAAMERPLARALKQMNFAFKQVGAEMNYYGPVAPYLADLRELEVNLHRINPQLLAWLSQPERERD